MLRVKHIYDDKTNDFEMFNAYLSSDDVFDNDIDTIIVRDGMYYNIYFLDEERWVYDNDEQPTSLNDCINAAMQELMDREVTFKFGETMETLQKEAEEYEANKNTREEDFKKFCEEHVKPYFFNEEDGIGGPDTNERTDRHYDDIKQCVKFHD